jgi:hypothetical protein
MKQLKIYMLLYLQVNRNGNFNQEDQSTRKNIQIFMFI